MAQRFRNLERGPLCTIDLVEAGCMCSMFACGRGSPKPQNAKSPMTSVHSILSMPRRKIPETWAKPPEIPSPVTHLTAKQST